MTSVAAEAEMTEDEPQPPVIVQLLGDAGWRRAELEAGGNEALTPKDAALLAKLALDGPQARGALCLLLWPEATKQQGAANLRQRVSRLKKASGVRFIDIGDTVRLHHALRVDVAALDALDEASLLAVQPLLAGVDLGMQDELDRWLARARTQVADACAQRLAARADALEGEGRLHEALPLARRVIELLPLGEQGWRRLMRLHYLLDDRAAAQDVFWRLMALLRDELGIRPSAETLQLMQTVETADLAQTTLQRSIPVSLLRPPALIGRDRAFQAMASAWQQGRPFFIVGEAGIGKSRLLEAFVHGVNGVLIERAQDGDTDQPYSLLRRLLRRVDTTYAPMLSGDVRDELGRLDPAFGAQAQAPAHDLVIWRAVEQLLAAALPSGLHALVVDDAHRADEASVAMLRRMGASTLLLQMRLGVAARPCLPHGLGQPLALWLADTHSPARVDLEPLSPKELGEFLASLALPSLVDADLAALLHRHAGGHPLYTLATLQDAITRRIDLRGRELPRPSSVQALLEARLSSLPDEAQDLLRVAAVAGADLTADRAARLLDRPMLALTGVWAMLEAANVLRGEAFSHDLVHECALRSVPLGVRQALHRRMAAILADDPATGPARIAWHWEQGERWSEAGRCWHAAGMAAHRAGRLAEQGDLYRRAARCHAQAGDMAAQFEALHAWLSGLELQHGGGAVLVALPEVEALADTHRRRLCCRLSRAAACIDLERTQDAVFETAAAVAEAALHPDLLADAEALHSQALVQSRRYADAMQSANNALRAACEAGNRVQELRALQSLAYVHYASGRLADAVSWQQRVVVQAEALDFRAEAAAAEGDIAAQLAAIGDVCGTCTHALRAQQRQQEVGLAANSTVGIVNHIVLGAAAAARGWYDTALASLAAALGMAGDGSASAAQAKARITQANLWLSMGRSDLAYAAVQEMPQGIGPGMQMQVALARARAAEMAGTLAQRHWQTLAALVAAHADLPLVQSAHFEASFQGEPTAAIGLLRAVHSECQTLGLHGTARAMQWRELVRWLEVPGAQATQSAHDLALQLQDQVALGLSAKCHPPLVWLSLWQAFGRAGSVARQRACREAARRWLNSALERVPPEHRPAFECGHPVHAWWLGDGAGPVPQQR